MPTVASDHPEGQPSRPPLSWGRGRSGGQSFHEFTDAAGAVRFVVSPSYRSSRRGPNVQVHDGFNLLDTLTRANRHYFDLATAKAMAERTLAEEAEIDWASVVAWTAAFERIASLAVPLVELRGARADGSTVKLALVGVPFSKLDNLEQRRAAVVEDVRGLVETWLSHVGHADLVELS
jgi:hypothetical protein